MSRRFTVDGDDALEAHLASVCEEIRNQVLNRAGDRLQAILLGGGYGRGEGGVWRCGEVDRPYNDLEFYVCMRGAPRANERKYGPELEHVAKRMTDRAGLEVELKITSLARIRRSNPSMFWYDLVMGHRCVLGDESLLSGFDQHRQARQIPLHEATRLLMNRCSGLLFAREQLERDGFAAAEADFVGRNLAKAQLGFGDAVLAAEGQYHWSCRERHRRLEKFEENERMPWLNEIKKEHCAGMAFKLHPVQQLGSKEMWIDQWQRLTGLGERVWIWLESRRLKRTFVSGHAYGFARLNRCPESSAWRNAIVVLRAFGWREALRPGCFIYPRDRLLRALALLLWSPSWNRDERALGLVQGALRTTAADWSGLARAYEKLWSRFN